MTTASGWRVWRPAIWLAMLGVAFTAIINPYLGVLIIGGALGVALRITRRRLRPAPDDRITRRRRRPAPDDRTPRSRTKPRSERP